jgi:AraC family transcriptional regulator, regulatory protein of adaptative response / methylated-DNA-[protein]-cysteine methyltransferase
MQPIGVDDGHIPKSALKNRWQRLGADRYPSFMKTLPPIAEMQRAYQASDAAYDGIFFLAVRTTGVFCRPSCRARKPNPENVVYFASEREALFAGFRPRKR